MQCSNKCDSNCDLMGIKSRVESASTTISLKLFTFRTMSLLLSLITIILHLLNCILRVHILLLIGIHAHRHIYVRMYIHSYMRIDVFTHGCTFTLTCAHLFCNSYPVHWSHWHQCRVIYAQAHVYKLTYRYVHTYTRLSSHAHTHAHSRSHAHASTCACTYISPYLYNSIC